MMVRGFGDWCNRRIPFHKKRVSTKPSLNLHSISFDLRQKLGNSVIVLFGAFAPFVNCVAQAFGKIHGWRLRRGFRTCSKKWPISWSSVKTSSVRGLRALIKIRRADVELNCHNQLLSPPITIGFRCLGFNAA
jgi:hypothetical protein